MSRAALLGGYALSVLFTLGCAGHQAAGAAGVVPSVPSRDACSSQLRSLGPAAQSTEAAASSQLVAYVTHGSPSRLIGYDVAQARARFAVPVRLRNRPQVLRDVVVAVDSEAALVAYDARTGARRFRRELDRAEWLGAVQVDGPDGGVIVSVSRAAVSDMRGPGSTIRALSARDGTVRWEHRVPYRLSAPVAWGERVLSLVDHAQVWVLGAHDGHNAGCLPLPRAADWLDTQSGEVLAGRFEARRLSETASAPTTLTEGPALELPSSLEALPGHPQLHASAYDSVPAQRSAYGRVGLHTHVTAAAASGGISQTPPPSGLSVNAYRYYYVFYRALLAYQADGQLAWARLLDSDAVRIQPDHEELLIVTEAGQLLWLRTHDGTLAREQRVADRITSADMSGSQPSKALATPGLIATNSVDHRQAGSRPPSEHEPTAADIGALRQSLAAIALDTDTRLLPVRRKAVAELATLPDPLATRDLLAVYAHPAAPAPLKADVAALLSQRTSGMDALLEAVNTGQDFLTGQKAPPLRAVVPGLVRSRDARAVPGMLERLFDPNTALDELPLLVDGLATFGGARVHAELARFFSLYHADSALHTDVTALSAAARVLSNTSTSSGRSSASVHAIAAAHRDPFTLPALRDQLAQLTAAASAPGNAAAAPMHAASTGDSLASETPPRARLSDGDIASTLDAHREDLQACAPRAREAHVYSARLSFVVANDGTASTLSIWPVQPDLTACLTVKLTALHFPAFTEGHRRLVRYRLDFDTEEADAHTREWEEVVEQDAFWTRAQLRGANMPDSGQQPWWRDQNPWLVSSDESQPIPTTGEPVLPPDQADEEDGSADTDTHDSDTNQGNWWLPQSH